MIISIFTIILVSVYINSKAFNRVNILDFYVIVYLYDVGDYTPWSILSEERSIKCDWDLKNNQILSQDSIFISFTNRSNEKLFYITWGTPLSRLRTTILIDNGSKKDTIKFLDFGCYTGVEPFPIAKNETVSKWTFNPIYRYIREQLDATWSKENFRQNLTDLIGEKIEIQFEQAIYSPFWNKGKSQLVQSDFFSFESNEIVNNLTFEKIKNRR
jgi:hypothetical protein